MLYPPSLPADVKARAFHAKNGELGIFLTDTAAFLAACRSDSVVLLGWELWLVNHGWSTKTNLPVPAEGLWCGGIPVNDGHVPAVIGGQGDVDETERQLGATDLDSEVQAAWLPNVRVNFTIDG